MAASIKGYEGVAVALLRELYRVECRFRDLLIVSNMDPQVCICWRLTVQMFADGHRGLMGVWANNSYDDHE